MSGGLLGRLSALFSAHSTNSLSTMGGDDEYAHSEDLDLEFDEDDVDASGILILCFLFLSWYRYELCVLLSRKGLVANGVA